MFLLCRPTWWPYWNFSFSANHSSDYSELISLKIDWFDLLAVSGELSRVFSSTTIRKQQFFGALPSLWSSSHNHTWPLGRPQHWLYGPLLVMPLLFNTLSRFIITFLPRSNHLLISWLQSLSAVILETKKRKSVTASTFPPFICQERTGQDDLSGFFFCFLFFFNIEF